MKKIISILSLLWLFSACSSGTADVVEKGYYYTCSMHPQIHEMHPGTCPICGMDLIKVKETQSGPNQIELNEDQVRLGNIVVDTLSLSGVTDTRIITGIVTEDESHTENISSKISGRIEHLYFKDPGTYIKKGQPIFAIYSEELNNAKEELLSLLERKDEAEPGFVDFDKLIAAVKQKLLYLGMTDHQVNTLIQERTAPALTTYYSPYSGYITGIPAYEGDYVVEGNPVLAITDLSHLWVEAQVYLSQLAHFAEGDKVVVKFPGSDRKKVEGTISFISPEIYPDSRLIPIRISLVNPDGQFKPGMQAYVTTTPTSAKALTLPSDAIIRDEDKNVVWVQKSKGVFEWRSVEIGVENKRRTAVVTGLNVGDPVVVNGAYLLNSEYLLKKSQN